MTKHEVSYVAHMMYAAVHELRCPHDAAVQDLPFTLERVLDFFATIERAGGWIYYSTDGESARHERFSEQRFARLASQRTSAFSAELDFFFAEQNWVFAV